MNGLARKHAETNTFKVMHMVHITLATYVGKTDRYLGKQMKLHRKAVECGEREN